MYFRKLSRLLLLILLLFSAVSLTPVRAEGQSVSDPTAAIIWCPASVLLPISMQNGCSPAHETMTALLDYLSNHQPSQAGTVWIGKNYDSSKVPDVDVFFDGGALVKMAQYPLTLKGGWNRLGVGTVDLKTPSTFDGDSFYIHDWKGNVTFRNILVQNATTTSCSYALCVETDGNIKLDHVQVSGSSNLDGASLYNYASSSSTVTVTNSQFNDNVYGLNISSDGTITLANVHAEGNSGHGAMVNNYDRTDGLANVFLKGMNTFLNNAGYGLYIQSNGTVTVQYLLVYKNGGGVQILNGNAPSAKAVAITGGGEITGNGTGLEILSKGNVSLNRVNTDSNSSPGIKVLTDGSVTLTCSGTYGNNVGISIHSLGGGSVPKLTFQGFLSYGNTVKDEDIQADQVVRTACP